jgi:predicted ATP-dependent endonuclease of OLD family
MKLKRFRVQMFKCILDSGWVNVTDLTVLVGKNEAGKTSLLKALQKFNPFTPEPYSMAREWPRGHRGERSDSQVACQAEFHLDAADTTALANLTTENMMAESLTVTRDYAGRIEVLFPEGIFPDRLHPNDVDQSCSELPSPPAEVARKFFDIAQKCRKEAVRLANEGRFSELESLATQQERELATVSPSDPHNSNETNFRTQYAQKLGVVAAKLRATSSMQKKAHECVINRLPTFVYMDEYRTFRGTAYLDQVKQRFDMGKPTEDDQTLITILNLAELNLTSEVTKAEQGDREERQYDLSDAAATLNRKIENHWKQLRYEVDFRADGHQFMTFVRGLNDKTLIRLEERSRGFQWFFSFDLMLMHETKGTLKDCVILLDEPGLHLHPDAQVDLLERLASYAEGNTLIYSTHLPFMIEPNVPERIRIIGETDAGTVVTESLIETDPSAKLVLQAALGIQGCASFLVADQNLVVEGVDDYWILTALSNLFRKAGEVGLPFDVLVTPAGGASEVTYIATFMVGQNLSVFALYDSDSAGETAKGKLIRNWLTRYAGRKAVAFSLGEILGTGGKECSIEDLFPENFYIKRVHEVYSKQLAAAVADLEELPAGDQLSKRIAATFAAAGVKYNKGSVCKVLCRDLREMKNLRELPSDTAEKAKAIFAAIEKEFSNFSKR